MYTCDTELTIRFFILICDKTGHLSTATDLKCGIQTGPINLGRVVGESKLRNIYESENHRSFLQHTNQSKPMAIFRVGTI